MLFSFSLLVFPIWQWFAGHSSPWYLFFISIIYPHLDFGCSHTLVPCQANCCFWLSRYLPITSRKDTPVLTDFGTFPGTTVLDRFGVNPMVPTCSNRKCCNPSRELRPPSNPQFRWFRQLPLLGPPADCVPESRRRRKKMRYEQQQTWEITPEDQHIALNPRWALEDVFSLSVPWPHFHVGFGR